MINKHHNLTDNHKLIILTIVNILLQYHLIWLLEILFWLIIKIHTWIDLGALARDPVIGLMKVTDLGVQSSGVFGKRFEGAEQFFLAKEGSFSESLSLELWRSRRGPPDVDKGEPDIIEGECVDAGQHGSQMAPPQLSMELSTFLLRPKAQKELWWVAMSFISTMWTLGLDGNCRKIEE